MYGSEKSPDWMRLILKPIGMN